MTKQDWDKCFIWLMGAFPQWNATSDTSAVWYAEIGQLSPADFQISVRSLMHKKPSAFPPGVFEIKKEAMPVAQKRMGAEEAWNIGLRSMDERRSVIWTDEIAEAMGACHEQVRCGDMVAARMAFREKYEQLIEDAERDSVPINWRVSLGFDKNQRASVIEEGLRKNLISTETAYSILPPEEALKICAPYEYKMISTGDAK